jgi:hypothetical protein
MTRTLQNVPHKMWPWCLCFARQRPHVPGLLPAKVMVTSRRRPLDTRRLHLYTRATSLLEIRRLHHTVAPALLRTHWLHLRSVPEARRARPDTYQLRPQVPMSGQALPRTRRLHLDIRAGLRQPLLDTRRPLQTTRRSLPIRDQPLQTMRETRPRTPRLDQADVSQAHQSTRQLCHGHP